MKLRYYTFSGLRIASELPIPEWSGFEHPYPAADTDVLIKLGNADNPDMSAPSNVRITAGEYLFHVPEAGTYWVHDGREIVVTPGPEAGEKEMRLFLLGSAWGALCYQRGMLALHCSVVQAGECAFAFCGTAGAGKSTTAAFMSERGYRMVGDDLCRFDLPPEGKPLVYPSAPRLKLWRDALDNLGRSHDKLERDHFHMDKFHLPYTHDPCLRPIPLQAIFLLEWGDLDLVRLKGMTALRRFIFAATYRADILEHMGQVAGHWLRCASLLERVPVLTFRRRRDWSTVDETMEFLLTGTRSACNNHI